MYNYITLAAVKRYIGGGITTSDDDLLLEFIEWAARLVESWKGRRYDPRMEIRVYDTPHPGGSMFGVYDASLMAGASNRVLRLDEDLLEVVELTNGDGTVLADSEFVLEPANIHPKNRIRLRSGQIWLESDSGPEQAISLSALWGYHDRWGDAWKPADTVQDDPLSSNAVTVTITDAAKFEAGQLLRIGSEYVLIETVNENDPLPDTLTVERGFNGTTAVEHTKTSAIEIFHPFGPIQQICIRLVKWRYAQKNVDVFDQTYVIGSGVMTTPSSIPADVARILGARKVVI